MTRCPKRAAAGSRSTGAAERSKRHCKLRPMRVGGIGLRDLFDPGRGSAEARCEIATRTDEKFDVRQLSFDLLADLRRNRLVGRCESHERVIIGRTQSWRRGEVELPEIDKLKDPPIVEKHNRIGLTAVGLAGAVERLEMQRLALDGAVDVVEP